MAYRKIKSVNNDQLKEYIQQISFSIREVPTTANDLNDYAKTMPTPPSPNSLIGMRRTGRGFELLDQQFHSTMRIMIRLSAPAGKQNANGLGRDFHQTVDYKKERNYATNLMNKARQELYSQLNSSSHKKLFNAANKLLSQHKQLRSPKHTNKIRSANNIGRYLVRKIERICTDIDSIHPHPQDQDLVPQGSVTNRTLNSFNNWKKLYYIQKEGEKLRQELDLLHLMFGYQCDKPVNKNDTREVI